MGPADDFELNFDERDRDPSADSAADAFLIAIAATVKRMIRSAGPALQIVARPSADAGTSSPVAGTSSPSLPSAILNMNIA